MIQKTLEQKRREHAKYMNNYYHNNPKYREKQIQWQKKNHEKVKEYGRKAHLKRIRFKDKFVYLDENPRIGVCSQCGKCGKTDMHHDKYDEKNPLAYTRELCVLCHKLEHGGRDSQGRWIHL